MDDRWSEEYWRGFCDCERSRNKLAIARDEERGLIQGKVGGGGDEDEPRPHKLDHRISEGAS